MLTSSEVTRSGDIYSRFVGEDGEGGDRRSFGGEKDQAGWAQAALLAAVLKSAVAAVSTASRDVRWRSGEAASRS